ncbi:MAG: CPBP family intramembrane metalloprotease [Methylococcaceae bacterium]|nr:CPBP family intramembrane metalloprotease [Methylococcaceae bacterium]
MQQSRNTIDPSAFFRLATWFEGSLVVIAAIIGWLGGLSPWQDLTLDLPGLGLGLAGTLPLYLLFVVTYRAPLKPLQHIHDFLVERMGPLLDACGKPQLAYLALLAGFTEETLFRGVLQPLIELHWGWVGGLIVSNVMFALAHAITRTYALLAGITGIYLGLALDVSGERNLLIPMTVHALYDFLAFLAVAETYRRSRSRSF